MAAESQKHLSRGLPYIQTDDTVYFRKNYFQVSNMMSKAALNLEKQKFFSTEFYKIQRDLGQMESKLHHHPSVNMLKSPFL